MAVDQDLLDDIAATVADLYRDLESALNKQIADRLDDELDSPYQITKLDAVGALRRSAQLLISTLQATRARVIRDAIGQAYRDGYGSALTDLPEGWFPRSGIGQAARAAQQEFPGAPVIENIAAALHRDLGRVEGNILRATLDAYRSVQAAAAARIVSGAFTRRQAAQAAWQKLVDRGVTSFVDSAGRRWKLSSYAEMITRTNAARAAVQGQTDRLTSIGVNLVIASDHSQECKLCRPYEGKVLAISGPTGQVQVQHATRDGEMITVDVVDTLDGARAKGFQHPNCRHSVSAYLPGLTKQLRDTADPQGDQARQRQREIERQIRKHKERANTALTPEGKKAANAKVRQWQAELRDHLAAHPDLKRLRYREQPGAGNTPPKGGPAGGPVGDLQPPVQPALDDGSRAPRPAPEAEPPRSDEEARRRAAEEQAEREAAERAQREAQEQERRDAEEAAERAQREAEERAAQETAEKAQREAEEQARREAEAAARAAQEAEEKARREAAERAAKEAADKAQQAAKEAAEKAQREAEERARKEAEDKARRQAEEAAEKARREAEARAAREKAEREAAAKAKAEAAERARRQTGARKTPGMKEALRHQTDGEGIRWAHEKLPIPKLTYDEAAAAERYSGSSFQRINNVLRDETRKRDDDISKVIRDLDSAISKSKLPEDVILHRDVGKPWFDWLGIDLNDPASVKSLIGRVISEKSYLSTAVGRRAGFHGNLHLVIRAPKGHEGLNMMPLSVYGDDEREILLRRNTRFIVHAAYKRLLDWYIELEIVPDDYQRPEGWQPNPWGDYR
ncbi:hypothetical protein Skr01_36400 [Sphaerisporangium krabiense]|uniref:ADP ribosyltransferase domain-containing protein n=1 Tax=Sphaerisporangium krabiense TaxID=763782 RepID=A0A7W9DPR5_9ACTN|nr:phage minor capsid protein [Sphaerisporangium krabiense]MBB5626633.1 hypothetical protein [Sphaerisporangium krabiense]GII63555.1 hypothetical protein Skr01_36400 [Sphaerisporangium krabiense]